MTKIALPRKRGRPSKKDIEARKAAEKKAKPKLTDEQRLADLKRRFDLLGRLTRGAIEQNIRALVVTGAPGVGKTHTVEQILSINDTKHLFVRGAPPTPINLYMMAYKYRNPGDVIVLDDVDDVFRDEECINMLKVLCDTSDNRVVSYFKEAQALKDNDIPQQFTFHGSIIFISNLDFQKFVDAGKNKFAVHFEALMNRAHYLDLRLHDRQSISVWVKYVVEASKIFDLERVPAYQRPQILKFVDDNRNDLRELSIRTIKKLCGMAKTEPQKWMEDAYMLLIK